MKIVRSELMFESRCQCKKVIVHYGECSVTNEYRETRREVFGSSLLVGQSNSKLEGTSARKTLSETDERRRQRLPLHLESPPAPPTMALISIHQSFHFKTAHLIFKYFICLENFVFGEFYHHYLHLHSSLI